MSQHELVSMKSEENNLSHECTPKLAPPKLVSAFSTSVLFFRNSSLFLIPNDMLQIVHRKGRFEVSYL